MDGLLVVDKPAGPTSHDIVMRARQALGEPRVGHTGTLDPMASGVLPLLLGRATRLAQFLMAADKVYDATFRLGVETDTYDSLGRPVRTAHPGSFPPLAVVDRAFDDFRGTFLQQPPAFSAKRVKGRRSYQTARAAARTSEAAAMAPSRPEAVRVTAHGIDVLQVEDDRVDVRIHCSAGFYVRSLAHDLGERLGTGAHVAALRRTRSGDRTIEAAVSIELIERDSASAQRSLVPLAEILSVAAVILTAEGVRRAVHGRDLGPTDLLAPVEAAASSPAGAAVRLLDARGELVGIAAPASGSGLLHPRVVLM